MERSKRIAIAFFKQFGFDVDDIPESDDKRADIRAFDSTRREYVTEVKDRIDDPDTVASQLKTISDGKSEFTFRVSPLDHSNALDGIFKDGGLQLGDTPSEPNAFRLLWLHCNGIDASLQAIRARNTFYGVVPVTPVNGDDGYMCFYFDFNTSFMLRHVNGLVIFEKDGITLYLNEFAENADQFRECELVSIMGDSVFDPKKIVANEEHIAFTGNISRKNESKVLDALQEQTGIKYRTARMNRHMF
jgi:hypothetical protein